MATLTNEQIEQKKQQLQQLTEQAKALYDELVEAGAITPDSPLATEGMQELSEDDLDQTAGGSPCFHVDSSSPLPHSVV